MPIVRFIYWLLELNTKFFNYLWKSSNKRATAKIQKLAREDSHAAVAVRKRLLRRRRVIKAAYHILIVTLSGGAGLFFIIWGIREQNNTGWDFWSTLFFLILGVPFLMVAAGSIKDFREEGIGNISTAEPSDIIGSGIAYALYLRAFEADKRRSVFKEEDLAQALYYQGILMAAVGLPEEVDAPGGAVRIYVGNATWQEEVRLMLDYASYVFLRICNTESCLWEVGQALTSQADLYIIVDNLEEYHIVREIHPQLPAIAELKPDKYVIYRRTGVSEWEDVTP